MLLKMAGMNDIKLISGQPPLADAWAQFLTERPVEYFRDGRAESIGEDEWVSPSPQYYQTATESCDASFYPWCCPLLDQHPRGHENTQVQF